MGFHCRRPGLSGAGQHESRARPGNFFGATGKRTAQRVSVTTAQRVTFPAAQGVLVTTAQRDLATTAEGAGSDAEIKGIESVQIIDQRTR